MRRSKSVLQDLCKPQRTSQHSRYIQTEEERTIPYMVYISLRAKKHMFVGCSFWLRKVEDVEEGSQRPSCEGFIYHD
jgi:hypothetical protein